MQSIFLQFHWFYKIEQNLQRMAFVFRSQVDPYNKPITPGPSHYEPQPYIKLQRPVSVPFNQSSPRNIWEINNLPGPGAYQVPLDVSYDRLVVQQSGKIFVMNHKSESFNFKSGIPRFKDNENKLPGPGQYDTSQIYLKKEFNKKQRDQSAKTSTNSLQKYLLKAHNTRPEKQSGKLEIILDDQFHFSNQNKGQKFNHQKKTVPFNSSVQRVVKIRPQTSLGPGSYNISCKQKPLENLRLKASYSLAKFKKINAAQNQQRYELNNQKCMSFTKEQKRTQDTTQNVNKFRKKDDFFGSTVGRFYTTQSGSHGPGPGAYDVAVSNDKKYKKGKSKLAFGRVSTPQKIQFNTFVSPFIANFPVEKRTQQKPVQKKKNLNFGSLEPRFKQIPEEKTNQFIEYSNLKICVGGKQNKAGSYNKENIKLKLKTNKHYHQVSKQKQKQKIEDQRPLCYAPLVNTISQKVGKKHQVNAPFSTQVTRFAKIEKEMNIIEDLLSQNQQFQSKKNRVKENVHPKGIMNSNNPRFNYKDSANNISPCSYDPSKPTRKQFNKLFL